MGLVEVMAWWAWGEVPGEGEAPPGSEGCCSLPDTLPTTTPGPAEGPLVQALLRECFQNEGADAS